MRKIFGILLIVILSTALSGCSNLLEIAKLNDIGEDCLRNGDNKCAIANLEKSLKLNENQYKTRYLLIDAYLRIDECDNAITEAIRINTENKKEASLFDLLSQAYFCAAKATYNEDLSYFDKETNKRVEIANIRAARKFIYNLSKGNEALDKYYELVPMVEDAQSIVETLKRNKETIENIKKQYGIQQ